MTALETYRKQFDLSGKTALVAGGVGGIGSAISEALAAFGARVVLTGISCQEDDCQQKAREITAAGGEAYGEVLDVTDVPALGQFMQKFVARYGVPHILINCVGTHKEAPALEYSEEDWDRIFAINLKGAFFLSQAVARFQVEQQTGGRHIHISSVRSLLGIGRGYISYCASKGGMNLMVKQLATEWAKHHITVNAIAPTFTRTELVRKYLDDPAFYNPLVARIPLGRVCEPQDIAALATYLASPGADFVTGQIIFIDGGLTATQ
ncbi:MAG: SDR family oxidoreductase [Anaerolineae bacterium]|nr:SDR family oxidoreductase [Anaerolineae bacterium]